MSAPLLLLIMAPLPDWVGFDDGDADDDDSSTESAAPVMESTAAFKHDDDISTQAAPGFARAAPRSAAGASLLAVQPPFSLARPLNMSAWETPPPELSHGGAALPLLPSSFQPGVAPTDPPELCGCGRCWKPDTWRGHGICVTGGWQLCWTGPPRVRPPSMPLVLSDRPAGPWAPTLESFLAMLMDAPPESAAAAMESAAAAENDDDDSAQPAPGTASAAPWSRRGWGSELARCNGRLTRHQ